MAWRFKENTTLELTATIDMGKAYSNLQSVFYAVYVRHMTTS